MLKILPERRPGTQVALELPLAALAEYPGAVAVIDRHGVATVVGGTLALLETLGAGELRPEIAAAAAGAIAEGVATLMVLAHGPDGPMEATFLPLAAGRVLLLLRPLGFEKALRRSLVESRQRYKDLVEIASDFTWETDAEGCFSFVSPLGALDWSADELVGRPVAEFIAGAETALAPPIFRTSVPSEDGDAATPRSAMCAIAW
jgi:PAS domain-containing protein